MAQDSVDDELRATRRTELAAVQQLRRVLDVLAERLADRDEDLDYEEIDYAEMDVRLRHRAYVRAKRFRRAVHKAIREA